VATQARPPRATARRNRPPSTVVKPLTGDPAAHPRPLPSLAARGTRRPHQTIRIDY